MHIIRHEERPPSDYRHASDLAILGERSRIVHNFLLCTCAKARARRVREKRQFAPTACDGGSFAHSTPSADRDLTSARSQAEQRLPMLCANGRLAVLLTRLPCN